MGAQRPEPKVQSRGHFSLLPLIAKFRVCGINVIDLIDTPINAQPAPHRPRIIPVTPSPPPIAAPPARNPSIIPPAAVIQTAADAQKSGSAKKKPLAKKTQKKKPASKRPLLSPKSCPSASKAVVDYKKLWQGAMKKERQKKYRLRVQSRKAGAASNSEAESILSKVLEFSFSSLTLVEFD